MVAIETRDRLGVKLSLFAIPQDAINAFQDICRDIILFRERLGADATPTEATWQNLIARRLAAIRSVLDNGAAAEMSEHDRLTVQDARRLQRHMEVLRNATMPLRRMEVKNE
ncbi:MAG: hypothetical protein ABIS29_07970 [Vicinamibacterales bacterium]